MESQRPSDLARTRAQSVRVPVTVPGGIGSAASDGARAGVFVKAFDGTKSRRRGNISAAFSAFVALVLLSAAACDKSEAPAAAPKPEVVVADVVSKDVELYTEWVGSTVGMIDAKIRPKIQGYLLSQEYVDGADVKGGELLFRVDPRQFKAALDAATGQLDVEKAILGKADIDVRRYTPLAEKGAVSQQELDNAIQAQAAGRASVAAAQANVEQARLNLQWTQIHSPLDGIAGIATVQVGDLVNSLTELTTVSQVDPIKVSIPISEIDYLAFARRRDERTASGKSETAPPLELILADGSTYPHPGHVTVTGRAVSATTGTIIVQGVFPNPERLLRPGQFAKVRAMTSLRKDALVVPQRAIKQTQGMNQVAVVGKDDKVSLVVVELGPRSGEEWIIEKGVTAGQKVIIEGLQKARAGMTVTPKSSPASKPGSKPSPKPTAAGA